MNRRLYTLVVPQWRHRIRHVPLMRMDPFGRRFSMQMPLKMAANNGNADSALNKSGENGRVKSIGRSLGDLSFMDTKDKDDEALRNKPITTLALLFALVVAFVIGKSDESVVRMIRTLYACYTVWRDYENLQQEFDNQGEGEDALDDEKKKQMLHELHLKCAKRLLDVCLMNGGIFIKVGQTIASMNHLLPEEYTSTFECCQDRAPCQTYQEIERVFIQEFGGPPQQFFKEFDPKPLASASLAQVHRAKLHSGEDVVVKIQYNSIEDRMMDDIKVLSWINNLYTTWGPLNTTFDWLLNEFRTNLNAELDFIQEARNCEKFGRMFKNMPEVTCPKIHWGLTSRKVITMEYIDGIKITDLENMRENDVASVGYIASLLAAVYGKQIFLDGVVHCDPHPGNIFIRRKSDRYNDIELVFLDHGLYREMEPAYRLNYNKLWMGLMFRDSDVVKQYTTEYSLLDNKAADNKKKKKQKKPMTITERSLDELYRLFGSMCLSRRWNPDEPRIGMDPDLTEDEANWIKQYVQDNLRPMNLVLANCPKDLLLLFKVNEHMRSINQILGSPVNYFTVFSLFAQHGLNVRQRHSEQKNMHGSSTLYGTIRMGVLAVRQFIDMLLMLLFKFNDASHIGLMSRMHYEYPTIQSGINSSTKTE